jgi:hypothetical protein
VFHKILRVPNDVDFVFEGPWYLIPFCGARYLSPSLTFFYFHPIMILFSLSWEIRPEKAIGGNFHPPFFLTGPSSLVPNGIFLKWHLGELCTMLWLMLYW